MSNENLDLKNYLLQDLPENEMNIIDSKIFTNEEFPEKLSIAEDELIEDYLENRLTNKEKLLFHKNFLTTERRRENLIFITTLKNAATDSPKKVVPVIPVFPIKKDSQKMFGFFRFALAFGAFFIVGLIIWQIGFGLISDSRKKEFIALNKQDLSNLTNYQNNSLVKLAPNVFRSADGSEAMAKSDLTETVLFQLALPKGFLPREMRLLKNNVEVFSVSDVKTYQNNVGSEIRFLFPAKFFDNTIYEISVNNESETVSYQFAFQ